MHYIHLYLGYMQLLELYVLLYTPRSGWRATAVKRDIKKLQRD